MTTVYASIGNTDNKLTQQEWSRFVFEFQQCMTAFARDVYGVWLSESSSSYQNACIAIQTNEPDNLRVALAMLAHTYQQDSIAFATVARTESLSPPPNRT